MTDRIIPPFPGVDPATAPTPDDPEYSDWMERVCFTPEGIDRTQIWESLHQTPTERLRRLQAMMDFAFSVKPRAAEVR
jgi:hypothetical protein